MSDAGGLGINRTRRYQHDGSATKQRRGNSPTPIIVSDSQSVSQRVYNRATFYGAKAQEKLRHLHTDSAALAKRALYRRSSRPPPAAYSIAPPACPPACQSHPLGSLARSPDGRYTPPLALPRAICCRVCVGNSSSSNASTMDPDFLHAINGDWDSLLAAMRESRSLVHRTDSSGMSILHWICLHQDIPTDVVIKVVFANPHAVQLRNDAGHLPIDLAIQAECGERILEILRAASTGAAQEEEEEEEEHLEPSAEIDFGQSYFHNVNNNNRHQQQSRPQYQQQQQQQHSLVSPQSNYQYRQQEQRNNNNNYHIESPAHQMVMYGHHNQQQQQQRGRDNSYRDYPEEDDDDDRYSGRALHAPPPRHAPSTRSHRSSSASKFPQQHPDAKAMYSIYSNQTGAERDEIERERGRSHSSSTSVFNSMVLTEQRLQQREHDLISYATEDHHHDIFDPSLGSADINRLLQQPAVVGGEWGKPRGDSGGGAGSVTNGKKPRAQSSFPPRWKQSRNCHVCMAQWTMMKRRHHCRNCGQSVCGAHSTNRVALPKFGLMDPQRICDKCFLSGHHMASVLPVGSGSFGIGSIASSNTSYHQQ